MKKVFLSLLFLLTAGIFQVMADDEAQFGMVTENPANNYVDFFFNGFTFKIPQGMPVNMEGTEATIKNTNGTFGVSIKSEKDANASAQGAYGICQRAVTDLHLIEAKLTKVNINGLEGAVVEGKLEGTNVAIEVLNGGKKYLKTIIIYDDSNLSQAKTILTSIKKD